MKQLRATCASVGIAVSYFADKIYHAVTCEILNAWRESSANV